MYRLYKEEGLTLKKRPARRKRSATLARLEKVRATRPNQVWSLDFVSDQLADGRRLTLATGDLRSSGKKRASAMPDTPSEFVPFPVNLTMLDHIMLPKVGN